MRHSLKADRSSIEARESDTVALAGESLPDHLCHPSALKHERYTSTAREMRDVSCVIRHTEALMFNKALWEMKVRTRKYILYRNNGPGAA